MTRPLDQLQFLSDFAVALSEVGQEADVYQFVSEQLAPLAPTSLVMTISYEPRTSEATIRAVVGPEDMQRIGREVAGEPIGQVLLVDQEARQILSEGKLTRVAGGMHQLTFRTWSAERARRFEERLAIRSVHGQPFSRGGDFLGAVALASRESTLENARLIEVLVRLAAVAIQRRRAESQLRESEQRFRMLAENSRDVIFRLRARPKLELEYVSPATERLFGITPEQLYADPRLAAQCLFPEAWLTEGTLREPLETVVAHCQTSPVWMEQNFTPIRDASGAIVAVEGIARDITKRKDAEEALLEADRRKTEFLAVLSHELRNPLGAIRNGAYVLGHAEPGGEPARRALAMIERQIAQLTRLIDDLLDITRITRGKVHLHHERIELNELVRSTVEDYATTFQTGKISVEVIDAPVDVVVVGDRTRLRQIIDNLLHNAAKFTPPGGRASVSVNVDSARKEVLVCVHNTGSSIPKELVASLFEPFVQADRTLDRKGGGLGLGLALVKRLVEMHGGAVEVESHEATGTAFTIRLPVDATVSDANRASSAEAHVPESAQRRVLVIEDNEDAAESLCAVLELHGNTVAIASNGSEGIEVARRFRPDVVLCDVGLPVMNGYEVARAIRDDPTLRTLPLVALTGYATPEDVRRAREAGFDQHVAKPLNVDKLEGVIADVTAAR